MFRVVNILILLSAIPSIFTANILYLDAIPSPSHQIWNRALVNGLALRGHNITLLSFSNEPKLSKNITFIHLERGYDALYGKDEVKNDILSRHRQRGLEAIISAYKFGSLGCIGALNSNGFQRLLDYPDDFNFDIVIYDATCGPCLLGFAHKFQSAKLIGVSPFNTPFFSTQLVGGHKNFAYVPHFADSFTIPMDFRERLRNFLIHIFDIFYRRWIYLPHINSLTKSAYPPNTPNPSELERKTDLLFVNSHPLIDGQESLPQNVIQVAGLQISTIKKNEKEENLPIDLRSFIESTKKGSILFSMGTNFRTELFSHEEKEMFFKIIREMSDYNFLWKFDVSQVNGFEIPSNLIVRSWLPQQDILAHSNVIAFISHCGLLSTHEAYWFGVPIIGIPVYVDQHINCARIKKAEVGEVLSLMDLTVNETISTIRRVVENPKYRENMKIKSKIFRSQKETPIERAVWWVEWLVNNSPDHLKSPTVNMNFIQSNSYDVIFFIFLAFYAIFHLLNALSKFIIFKWKNRKIKSE